jgi:hypothetical protein
MQSGSSKHDLMVAVEAVREARDGLLAAVENGQTGRGEQARAYFAAIEVVLRGYSDPKNWPTWNNGNPLAPLPPDISLALAGLAGYLALGRIPEPISDCAKQGRTAPGPSERRDLQLAVAYVTAVRAGTLADKHPIKTVTTEFGVDRRTVQGWVEAYDSDPAHVACGHVNLLPQLMREAGWRYQRAGRSKIGIAARASKRVRT